MAAVVCLPLEEINSNAVTVNWTCYGAIIHTLCLFPTLTVWGCIFTSVFMDDVCLCVCICHQASIQHCQVHSLAERANNEQSESHSTQHDFYHIHTHSNNKKTEKICPFSMGDLLQAIRNYQESVCLCESCVFEALRGFVTSMPWCDFQPSCYPE